MINLKFRYLLFIFILATNINALEDKKGELNLQPEIKLNRIDGKSGSLVAIEAELISELPNSKKEKKDILNSFINTSNYTKVKLIDVVLETLSHSDLLKASKEKVIQYDIKLKNAMANFYPEIDFEYNYGKTRSSPGDNENKYKFFNDSSYKIRLKQNLYAGGGTVYDVKSVSKKLEVSKNQYKIKLEEEIKKAIKAYFGVVFTNRSVMVNIRNMKKLNRILEIITLKYDSGAASIGDLTAIKANVANSMTKLVKVKSKFIEALRFYEYTAGIEFNRTLPYEMNFNIQIGEFESLYKTVLEKNRNLINYYKSIEAEKFKQKNAESVFKPKIDFEVSYQQIFDEEDLEEEKNYLNGKVKLSYNLYNGNKDKNKVLETNSTIRDLQYRLSEEKKKLRWNLSKIHTSINSVNEALKNTINEVKASRKMVGAYWEAFKLGEQDLQALLLGQRQLNSAETELVKYEQGHIISYFNILEITGSLSSFFDVNPDSDKFIDFSKSNHSKNIYVDDGIRLNLEPLPLDNEKSNVKETAQIEKDILKEDDKKEKVLEIPLPKISIDKSINLFLEKFLKFDNESYMIEISNFGNIYESFNFIKEQNIESNSFSYDVVESYNIRTKIAHNNFKTKSEALNYIKVFKSKDIDKNLKVKKVKDIKLLYSKYIDGLKIKVKKEKPKVKIVEKIKRVIKKKEFYTNEEFKNKFLSSDDNKYTINVSSFTRIKKLENFVVANKIYKDSLFFRYGDNGKLIKLIYGIYDNYGSLDNKLKEFISNNKNIFPVVEKIGSIKRLYQENLYLNKKKEIELKYEYIDVKKTKNKKELKKIKSVKEDDELLTITKRPSLSDINKKNKEKIKEVKKELEGLLSPLKENKEIKPKKSQEPKIEKKIEKLVSKNLLNDSTFEKKFLEAPKEYYTLNLASLKSIESAHYFVQINNIKENALLVISNSGKIMVMSGIYSLRDEALNAVSDLPDNIKRNKPYIQKIFRTQESYLKNNLKRTSEIVLSEESKAKKLVEQNRLEALELIKLAKVKELAEEKIKVAKLAKEKILEVEEKAKKLVAEEKIKAEAKKVRLKNEEELKTKKLAEQKRLKALEHKKLAEEKIRLEKLAELKRLEELKAKKLAEQKRLKALELTKLTEEKIRLEKLKKAEEKFAKEKKLEAEQKAKKLVEEEKIKAEAKKVRLKKEEELKAKKLAEEKLVKEKKLKAEQKAKKLVEQEKIKAEAKKVRLKKAEESKAKKLAEKKRLKALELTKLAEEKIRLEKLEELKRLEELKKAEDLKLKKLAEEKLAKEKKLEAEQKAKKLAKNTNKNITSFDNFKPKKEIEEIDFANDSQKVKKTVVIPYTQRLKDFKNLFYKAKKSKYTLKLTTIRSDKVKWYVHRFALEPSYIAIKRGNKSDIYYGIFDTVLEALKKTETLHPKIYESKPKSIKIGNIR